jgi:hypothetical protein
MPCKVIVPTTSSNCAAAQRRPLRQEEAQDKGYVCGLGGRCRVLGALGTLDEQQGLVRNRLRGLETQKQKNPQARRTCFLFDACCLEMTLS